MGAPREVLIVRAGEVYTMLTHEDHIEFDKPSSELIAPSLHPSDPGNVQIEYAPVRRFITRGKEIFICWSSEFEQAIGVPLEVIDNMQREIEENRTTILKLQKENRNMASGLVNTQRAHSRFIDMTFWQRIKNVFRRK